MQNELSGIPYFINFFLNVARWGQGRPSPGLGYSSHSQPRDYPVPAHLQNAAYAAPPAAMMGGKYGAPHHRGYGSGGSMGSNMGYNSVSFSPREFFEILNFWAFGRYLKLRRSLTKSCRNGHISISKTQSRK